MRNQLIFIDVLGNFATKYLQKRQLWSDRSIFHFITFAVNSLVWIISYCHVIRFNKNKHLTFTDYFYNTNNTWCWKKWNKIEKKNINTSQPLPGEGPSHPGGGPPYFRCPVVTSKLYPVLSRIALILSSSGPWWGVELPLELEAPALVFCL